MSGAKLDLMLFLPLLIVLLSLGSICVIGHVSSSPKSADELPMPVLPAVLQKLNDNERNCLFIIYTMSKLFENKKVQQTLAKESCDSNGTLAQQQQPGEADIWKSHEKSNGWCELNMDRIIDSEYGPMIMHAHGSVASINGARLFVKTTSGGIWIAIYQPGCLKGKDNESKDSEEIFDTLKRVRRWILQK